MVEDVLVKCAQRLSAAHTHDPRLLLQLIASAFAMDYSAGGFVILGNDSNVDRRQSRTLFAWHEYASFCIG
jgi:hypothetical protein